MELQIIEKRQLGKTRQEIADDLNLTKKQIKNWINRYNKCIAKEGVGVSKQRGQKPTGTLSEYKYENKRLKMENELLRDFLRFAGRR
jgi:transposase